MTGATGNSSPLGEFLRARRALVDPNAAGLPVIGLRRTPGLRREEVALLAGVSTHYYTRLEQGRNNNPSHPVMAALARVLDLDQEARAHLCGIVTGSPYRRAVRATRMQGVRPELERLLQRWHSDAVILVGRYQDVLYANDLAQALSPGFVPGRNLVQDIFLDAQIQRVHVDLEASGRGAVARLRASAGGDLADYELAELVDELSAKSPEFVRLWNRHDVQQRPSGTERYNSPVVGPITLAFESFAVADSEGQLVYVFHPEPGSDAEDVFAQLGQRTVGRDIS